MDDLDVYGSKTIDRLVEGLYFWPLSGWSVSEGDSWADIRAVVERTGDLENGRWLEVIDIENALAQLRGFNPRAAAVVQCALFNYDKDEMEKVWGSGYVDLLERGKRFMSAFLNGEDPEQAFRKHVDPRRKKDRS